VSERIYYCYFNKNSVENFQNEYTKSWEKHGYLPTLINETSFDVNKFKFTKEAYQDNKYAFVSDVARLEYLYHNGGIYCDTDVRMIKNIDEFTKADKLILSFEYYEWELTGVNLGTIITPPKNPIIKEVLDIYSKLDYKFAKTQTINYYFNKILADKGLLMNNKTQEFDDFKIIPYQLFCKKSQQSYLIHEYSSSWKNKPSMVLKTRRYIGKKVKKIIGKGRFQKIWKK
jgi:mannosyltransferase OCH1-like enzyme